VEKVSFEPGMKQWMCDGGWEWWAGGRWIRDCDIISRMFLCEVGGMRQEIDSRDEVMHSEMSDWWFLEKKMWVVEKGWQQMRSE